MNLYTDNTRKLRIEFFIVFGTFLLLFILSYAVTFAYPQTSNGVRLTEGRLITAEGHGVYRLENGKKRPIPSPQVFRSHNFDFSNVKSIEKSDLESIPGGDILPLQSGTIAISQKDQKAYLIEEGKKRYIPDPKTLQKSVYTFSEALQVQEKVLSEHPNGKNYANHYYIANGTPIFAKDTGVYLVDNDKKRPIPNRVTYKSRFEWNELKEVSSQKINVLPQGKRVLPREGTLLADNEKVYLVRNNSLSAFRSIYQFQTAGFSLSRIRNVSPQFTQSLLDVPANVMNQTLNPTLIGKQKISTTTTINGGSGLSFSDDGKTAISAGNNGGTHKYTFDPSYDISTLVYSLTGSLPPLGNSVVFQGLAFSQDGKTMFAAANDVDGKGKIFTYSFSTPYSPSTGSWTGQKTPFFEAGKSFKDVIFNNEGSKMYLLANKESQSTIYEYELTKSFDISTASYTGNSLEVHNTLDTPRAIELRPSTKNLFVLGDAPDRKNGGKILQYTFSGGPISSAQYTGSSIDLSEVELPTGFAFNTNNDSKLIVLDGPHKEFYKYDISQSTP